MSQPGKSKLALFVAGGLISLAVLYSSLFTINEREMAVVLQFGKVVKSINEPGLYFKTPFIQQVRRLPATSQFWANGPDDMLVDISTADSKKIEMSAWAIWRIKDPKQFVTVLQTTMNAEDQVRQRVRAAIRGVLSEYDLAEAVRSSDRELKDSFGLEDVPELEEVAEDIEVDQGMGSTQETIVNIKLGREQITQLIKDRVEKELSGEGDGATDRGIELVSVGISSISFVDIVRQQAFERLKAKMEAIATRYSKAGEERKQQIINKANADAEKIRGEGEEQSKRIRGEVEAEIIEKYATAIRSTGDFYHFKRTLEMYEKSLNEDTRLILSTDSDLFRMLKEIDTGTSEPESN